MEKNIVLFDVESGYPTEHVVEVSMKAKVGEIQDLLGEEVLGEDYEWIDLYFYNQCSEVSTESLIVDAFEPDDVVKVRVGVPPSPGKEERSSGRKNIRNNSAGDIIVVAQTRKMKQPIFLTGTETKAVQFDFWHWTNKIELWRKDSKDGGESGEPIYKGWRYELDMGDKIAHYSYEDDGLHVHMNDPTVDAKLLDPVGDEMKKRERFFLRPIGGKLRLPFKNEGSEPLTLVSGKKTDFDVLPELTAGVEVNIEIKKNRRGFEFGLSALAAGGWGAAQNEKEYRATMFDAQEVADGKLIKVWRESGEYKASIVLTDNTEHPLKNTRTKHYRESDRISRKDWLNWTSDITGSIIELASAIVNGGS